jgi:hypothetical protein
MKVETKEKLTEHPMEMLFGIESGTTITEYHEILPEPMIESPMYDEKDNEIEDQLEEIYNLALGAASTVSDEIERVEGRYKASLAESATQSLNIALGSVREKRMMKEHKDKLQIAASKSKIPGSTTTNNNLIVANRNEILKMLADQP